MEIRINYTENTHIWRIEAIAEKHGYTQTADCYWTQIFKDENGNSIIATREEKVDYNPVEMLESMLSQETTKEKQEGNTMKTIETLNAMIKADRLGSIAARKAIRANVETVENIYAESISGTPAETVKKIVSAIGYESAVEIIASMVNRLAWDGRISDHATAWASIQENAWDEEAANRIGIYSNRIHAAHLNQIAEAMAEYKPEEPAQEAEEVTETAEPTKAHDGTIKKYTLCVGLFDKDTKRQEINTIDAYKIATNLFARHTGGATITEGRGIYTHESGEIVIEPSLVCMVYGATLESVETVAAALKIALNQESIAIECAEINSWFF